MSGHPKMSTVVTSSYLNLDSNWYPNMRATNHLTHSPNNISTEFEYSRGNHIYPANGSNLSIHHYGSLAFKSSSTPSKSLVLNSLFHVLSITKNLISVSQFSKNNNVFFEFHLHVWYVKDWDTGQTLLQGLLHDGLYWFDITPCRGKEEDKICRALPWMRKLTQSIRMQ